MKNTKRTVTLAAVGLFATGILIPQMSLRRVSAQEPPNLTGTYGYQAMQPISASNSALSGAVGVMAFDGNGKIVASQTLVETDGTPNAGALKVQRAQIHGIYQVNLDGTGTMAFEVGGEKPATFSFVITDGGTNIMLLGTGGGNILTIGSLRKQ
jgi:hypothetical protein